MEVWRCPPSLTVCVRKLRHCECTAQISLHPCCNFFIKLYLFTKQHVANPKRKMFLHSTYKILPKILQLLNTFEIFLGITFYFSKKASQSMKLKHLQEEILFEHRMSCFTGVLEFWCDLSKRSKTLCCEMNCVTNPCYPWLSRLFLFKNVWVVSRS